MASLKWNRLYSLKQIYIKELTIFRQKSKKEKNSILNRKKLADIDKILRKQSIQKYLEKIFSNLKKKEQIENEEIWKLATNIIQKYTSVTL